MFKNIFPIIPQNGHLEGQVKNWEITEDAEIWEGTLKNGWSAVQMTQNWNWFSDITNHVVGTYLLSVTHASRFTKSSAFLFISVPTLKKSK